MASFANNVSPTVNKRKKSKNKVVNSQPSFSQRNLESIPIFIKKNPSTYDQYNDIMERYRYALSTMNAKQFAEFRSELNPSSATIRTGFGLILLIKELDSLMAFDTSKRTSLVNFILITSQNNGQ